MAKSKKKLGKKSTGGKKLGAKKLAGKAIAGKKLSSMKAAAKKVLAKKAPLKIVSKVAAKATTKASVKVPVKKTSPKLAKPKSTPQAAPKASLKPAPKAAPKLTPKSVDIAQFVTPLDDRLIVRAATEEKKTPGGLFIPDSAMTSGGNIRGIVLSAGRGHRDKKGRIRPMDVKAGDEILFTSFSGSKLNYEGQEFVILRESDVLGILS